MLNLTVSRLELLEALREHEARKVPEAVIANDGTAWRVEPPPSSAHARANAAPEPERVFGPSASERGTVLSWNAMGHGEGLRLRVRAPQTALLLRVLESPTIHLLAGADGRVSVSEGDGRFYSFAGAQVERVEPTGEPATA